MNAKKVKNVLLILYIIFGSKTYRQGILCTNFIDDLHVYKNPNVSKSSTFNIVVDNLSSLDNNFLKVNGSEQSFFLNPTVRILFLSQHLSINLFPKVLLFLVVKVNIA